MHATWQIRALRKARAALNCWGYISLEHLRRFDLDRELNVPRARSLAIRMGTEADLDTIVDIYCEFPELYLADEFPVRPRHGGATAEWSEARARRAYCNRFRRGEVCFIASSEGKLAHINWAPPSMGRTGGVGTYPPSTS